MRWLAGRLAAGAAVIVVASVIIFALLQLSPGDPATQIAGPDATADQVEAIRRSLGLDRPLVAQYWSWISGLLTGDPGVSYAYDMPISTLLGQRIGSTLELAVGATLFMAVGGTLLGIAAASERSRLLRSAVDLVATAALSTPPFVSGVILVFLFSITWRLLPPGGQESFFTDPSFSLQYLALPVVALSLPGAAVIARLVSTDIRRARQEEFVRTAVAKGASPRRVTLRHVLPNSIGPGLVELGIRVGDLLGGAVVVEALFARNGMASLLVGAVQSRDYVLAQTLLLLCVVFAVLFQILAELSMARLDRRITLGASL